MKFNLNGDNDEKFIFQAFPHEDKNLYETSYMIYMIRVYETFQTTGIKCNFTPQFQVPSNEVSRIPISRKLPGVAGRD